MLRQPKQKANLVNNTHVQGSYSDKPYTTSPFLISTNRLIFPLSSQAYGQQFSLGGITEIHELLEIFTGRM